MCEPVKLIGSVGSSYSQRVEVALRLKGVPYEFIEEDLLNKSELLLTHNPIYKKVPLLLHGGRAVVESLVIIQYVDEAFDGPPLLPADPYDRATVLLWAHFIQGKCMKSLREALWTKASEAQRRSMEEAKENLALVERRLGDGHNKFFGGDSICVEDIAATGLAYWTGIAEEVCGMTVVTDEEFPLLLRWAGRYVDEEVVRQCLPR